MENVIVTLLEDIKEWDEETLGQFLCNIYALGRLDTETERDAEEVQCVLLMSPIMNPVTVFDYIYNRLDEYIDEEDGLEEEDLEEEFYNY